MAPPNNPSVARVSMQFSRDTRTFVNTFHNSKTPPADWTPSELVDLAQLYVDWWTNTYRVYASDGVCLQQVNVRVYDPDEPLAYDRYVSPPVCGQQAQAEAPGSATQTISWRTGLAGRKYRGRDYAVGLSDADIGDDDRVSSLATARLAGAALDLLVDLTAQSIALIVFHRADNTFTGVISFIIESLLDSQRRRLPGRGR
jgi:hypothetical protein